MVRLLAVVLFCLSILGSVTPGDADRTVVVWPEERVGEEYWVPFAVGGQSGVARCATVEEARALYAVLAAVMVR